MKRFFSILVALMMVAGLVTVAGAAVTIDVDFWNGTYAQDGPGDLGGIFTIAPGEQINVDIYFSLDTESISSASWDLQYNPALVDVMGTTNAVGWVLSLFEASAGSLKYQAGRFPGMEATGDNILFGSVLLECLGAGDATLILDDYLGLFEPSTPNNAPIEFGPVTLGTLNQVPIPGAVWLLGTGLIGLVGIGRKRKN